MEGPWAETMSVINDFFAALQMIGTGSNFKILLTFGQIVNSMFGNLVVPWPSVVNIHIQYFSWFNFELLNMTSMMCSFPQQNHYNNLLNTTLLPIGVFP